MNAKQIVSEQQEQAMLPLLVLGLDKNKIIKVKNEFRYPLEKGYVCIGKDNQLYYKSKFYFIFGNQHPIKTFDDIPDAISKTIQTKKQTAILSIVFVFVFAAIVIWSLSLNNYPGAVLSALFGLLPLSATFYLFAAVKRSKDLLDLDKKELKVI